MLNLFDSDSDPEIHAGVMSFESPDMAKEFPGLYGLQGIGEPHEFEDEDKPARRKSDVLVRRRDSRPERRGKGYRMFEEEDSEEELVADDSVKSPTKMKKHSKPSFKFPKRDKLYKPKEKDKDREGHHPHHRERDRWASGERAEGLPPPHKEGKKKEDKQKWRKRKLLGQAPNTLGVTAIKAESRSPVAELDVKSVFAVPLAAAVDRSKCHDGIQLPVIVRECIDYIEEFGLLCEGIYRISGVKSKVQSLKDAYNQGKAVQLHEHEPNIIASLLKLYLRELPEPVLTRELMPKFEEASTVKNVKQKVEHFQQLIEQLPTPNKLLLSWMIVHMTHIISKEKQNKMSLQNVSIVLSPTMQISHRVLNVLFTYARILFKDTVIKKYVPPLRPVSSHWSLELPESPSALEEELLKQESLLSQLHEELTGTNDSTKEEQLWEVQRVVTQLKRKIKNMKKSRELHVGQVAPEKVRHIQPHLPSEKLKQATPPVSHKDRSVPVAPERVAHVKESEVVSKEDTVTEQKDTATHSTSDETRDAELEAVEVEGAKPEVVVPDPERVEEKDSDDTPTKEEPPQPVESDKQDDVEVTKPTEVADTVQQDAPTEDTIESMDKEATPEVESPIPSSDTLEMELDGEEDETKNVDPLPKDDEPQVPVSEPFQEQFAQGMQLDDGDVPVLPPSDGILRAPPVYQQQLSASSEEGSQATREIYESHKIVSSEFSDDNSQTDEEPDIDTLQQQYNELLLEEEELFAMGDELRQKIDTEKSEIERLHQEIAELKSIREDLYDSDLVSSDSSEDEEDEEELREVLKDLQLKNRQLEIQNTDLASKVQEERQICLDVKVQIRMIQQRQLESSGGMLLMDGISESDALIDSLL